MRKLIFLITLFIAPVLATESSSPDDFNVLFAFTCMKHLYSHDKLRDDMQERGLEELPPSQAEFFLGGKPGHAWLMDTPSTRYVVSLRDDKVCSVFAQHAQQETVQTGFSALVETAPSPLVAKLATGIGPNTQNATTIAYTWSRSTDDVEILFVLTTSDSPDVTAQAMASISVVKKAN